jgi:hypothetical protein
MCRCAVLVLRLAGKPRGSCYLMGLLDLVPMLEEKLPVTLHPGPQLTHSLLNCMLPPITTAVLDPPQRLA